MLILLGKVHSSVLHLSKINMNKNILTRGNNILHINNWANISNNILSTCSMKYFYWYFCKWKGVAWLHVTTAFHTLPHTSTPVTNNLQTFQSSRRSGVLAVRWILPPFSFVSRWTCGILLGHFDRDHPAWTKTGWTAANYLLLFYTLKTWRSGECFSLPHSVI